MELFDVPDGMVRNPDHTTSILAAHGVKRITLREAVLRFADEMGPAGITDQDLRDLRPEAPESSLRKRRTELAQENWLVGTGRTRINANAQQEKVWVHRDHHPAPPPIADRASKPGPKAIIADLEREITRLTAILDANGIAH